MVKMMFVENNTEKNLLDKNEVVLSIGLNEFEEKVFKEIKPVLLLCIQQDPEFQNHLRVIEDIYRTFAERVRIYLLEEDALRIFMEKFAVKGTPTFLLFINGNEKGRLLGQTDSEELNHFLSRMLSP